MKASLHGTQLPRSTYENTDLQTNIVFQQSSLLFGDNRPTYSSLSVEEKYS